MTAFVPITDGIQAEVVYTLFGQVVENRLWFVDRQPPITSAQLQNLADGLFDYWEANLMPSLSEDLALATVVARDWTVVDGPFEVAARSPVLGGSSSPSHSANVAIRVRLRTGSGITFSNANFVPGIPRDMVDGNVINPVLTDVLFEHYAGLIDAAVLFGPFPAFTWVAASAWLNGSLRSEQLVTDVQGPTVDIPYVTQRRKRLP